MVLARRSATPAFIVPDEQSWTVWGVDSAAENLEPVLELGRARLVLLPDAVPEGLAAALASCLDELPPGVQHDRRPVPGAAGHSSEQIGHGPPSEHGGHGGDTDGEHDVHGHAEHGGGGHGDMMAITGDPSADGLVMEPMELTLGPLASPLPAGVVASIVLDGDVVAECTLRAALRQPPSGPTATPRPPDLLAPVAWATAVQMAGEMHLAPDLSPASRWLRLADVELERAVSHLAWLRALARLLGWATLAEQVSAALTPLLAARRELPDADAPLASAAERARRLLALCEDSRRLASRTAGRGVLAAALVRDAGLTGPAARASGVPEDARTDDPLYGELGFAASMRTEGDARARALLRLEEAGAAIALARAALQRSGPRATAPSAVVSPVGVTLEGPRGPLRAQRMPDGWRLSAPGDGPALMVAGRAAVGSEWATALVVLASFDLSSWEVGP